MHRAPALSFLALSLLASAALRAQCSYSWPVSPFAGGANDAVLAAVVAANGDVIAGGRFTTAGAVPASRVARWNGGAWAALGAGTDGDVHALAVLANGDVVAGGSFANAGGAPASCIARWDGSAWSALGAGVAPIVPFGASVQALALLPNGDLVAGGTFTTIGGIAASNVARWDGTAWSSLGLGCNGTVRALAVAANGDVYAAGGFLMAGGVACSGIARWDGAAWAPLGSGLGVFGANSVAVAANGDVVAGGTFVTAGGGAANRIASWNGASWSALGTGTDGAVTALLARPNGDVLAGGAFTNAGGLLANGLARWNGSAWAAVGAGTNGIVHALGALPTGAVLAVGTFTQAGTVAAGRIASADSSCAPTSVVLGTGCSGSGGLNTLVTTALPQLGGTFRAQATGMPALAFVLAVTGLSSTSLPLVAALPQAFPGCTLYASPDLVDVLLPVAGTASSALTFGASPALLGAQFFHQLVPLELDAAFAITGVSATNALQATLGAF